MVWTLAYGRGGERLNDLARAGYLAYIHTAAHQRRVEQAGNIVSRWLAACEKPYVSFSGGKDSSVLLHLVRAIEPSVAALYGDDEWELPETTELIGKTRCVRVRSRQEHTPWFTSWEEGAEAERGLAWWAEAEGYDGAAVAIRAEESGARKTHLRVFGTGFATKDFGWRCYPLAWWRLEDVWAYLVSRDVPYNRAYDRLSKIGVPAREQRIGPLATERALSYGQLAILKRGWPELYERFATQHPQAKGYV